MLGDFVSHVIEGRFENDAFGVVNFAFIDNRNHVKTDASSCVTKREAKTNEKVSFRVGQVSQLIKVSPSEWP